jgi:hypothetical protein
VGEGNSGQKDSGQLPEKKFYFCLFAFLLLLYLMTLSVRAVTLGGIRLSDRSPAPILLAAVPRVQQFALLKGLSHTPHRRTESSKLSPHLMHYISRR